MEKNDLLSEREREVVELLLQGKSNKQIALALDISNRTVEFHLSNIYSKMEVSSRTEAILKLTHEDLRESTGALSPLGLWNSTVDKLTKSTENSTTFLSPRRIPVKNLILISGAVLLTTTLAVLLFVFKPLATISEGALPRDEPFAPVSSQEARAGTYEYIAANVISTGEMTLELSPRLSPDVLEVGITAILPEAAEKPMFGFLFEELEITFQGAFSNIQLDERPVGGGGGSGVMEQLSIFDLLPSLEPGQVVQVHILVTFSDMTGLDEPVPFDLELVVGEPFPQQGSSQSNP